MNIVYKSIKKYTKSKKIRKVLKSKIIDGMTYRELSEKYGFTGSEIFLLVLDFCVFFNNDSNSSGWLTTAHR